MRCIIITCNEFKGLKEKKIPSFIMLYYELKNLNSIQDGPFGDFPRMGDHCRFFVITMCSSSDIARQKLKMQQWLPLQQRLFLDCTWYFHA